jgi:hypothetical protein
MQPLPLGAAAATSTTEEGVTPPAAADHDDQVALRHVDTAEECRAIILEQLKDEVQIRELARDGVRATHDIDIPRFVMRGFRPQRTAHQQAKCAARHTKASGRHMSRTPQRTIRRHRELSEEAENYQAR